MNIIDIILPNYLNSQHIMKHIMTITTMADVHLDWDDKNQIHPDWDEGFILKSFACTSPEWTYQFSQLKVWNQNISSALCPFYFEYSTNVMINQFNLMKNQSNHGHKIFKMTAFSWSAGKFRKFSTSSLISYEQCSLSTNTVCKWFYLISIPPVR